MNENFIVLERSTLDNTLLIHASWRLSVITDHGFYAPFDRSRSQEIAKECGPACQTILKEFSEFEGVESIVFSVYSIRIRKGVAFTWHDLMPPIILGVLSTAPENPYGNLVEDKTCLGLFSSKKVEAAYGDLSTILD